MSHTNFASGRRLAVILYMLVAFLFWVSLFLYIPTLSTYVQSKTHSLTLVGIVLAMYGLWQVLIRVPLGIAADWLGWRKPFILGGLVLSGLGAWTLNVSDGVIGLLLGRSLSGIAVGAWVLMIVAFNSLFSRKEVIRATTLITLASSVGRVVATSVTGSLNDWGGYSLPFLLAVGAAGFAFLLLIPVQEERRPNHPPSIDSLVKLIMRREVLLPTLLATMLQYVNWTATLSFIPIMVKQLGGTGVTQSLFVSINIGVVVLGNLVAAVAVNRFGVRRIIYVGFIILSMGLGVTALSPSLPILFVGQFQIGMAEGIIYPVTMGLSIQYVADEERNTAMGLHQAVYAIGTFIGPWLSGFLAEVFGLRFMFGLTAFACLVFSLFVASLLVENRS